MNNFKMKPLYAAVATLALGAQSSVSWSQQSDAADESQEIATEEIVVTGFKQSILNAIEAKRNADTIVEAISAADIGGLPDVSIADNLGRLPGVTFDRSGGQAGRIQVRGMGAGFVFSTLNGREQVTTDTRGTREIDFSQYPSELLSNVFLYKTPKASLIEGGVAGSVDLQTANPLEMEDDSKVFVSIRGSWNDRAEDVEAADEFGSRITLSYMGKFFEDTVGVSLGYARLDQSNVAAETIGLQYNGRVNIDPNGNVTDENPTDENGVLTKRLSEGYELQQNGGTDERDGYVASFVFQPNENFTAKADYFYSEFTTETFASGFRVNNFKDGEIFNPVVAGELVTGGTVTTDPAAPKAINFQVINDDSSSTAEVESIGINLEWAQDEWEIALDYSNSTSEAFEKDGISRAHLYNEVDDGEGGTEWVRDGDQQIAWQNNGLTVPRVNLSRDYTDLSSLRLSSFEIYPHLSDDESDAFALDGKINLDMPFISSVEAGARYSERRYNQSRQVFVYEEGSNFYPDPSLELTSADVQLATWKDEMSHLPQFPVINSQAVFDRAVAAGLVVDADGQPRDTSPRARWGENRAWSMTDRADVEEDVTAYYLQANIDTTVAGRSLTGNFGVRIVDTDQYSTGFIPLDVTDDPFQDPDEIFDDLGELPNPDDTQYVVQRLGESYSKTLPSINLNFALTDVDNLRFSYATVLSRAPIAQLANVASGRTSEIEGQGVARYDLTKSQNPFLRPFEADQFDISYEHYFEELDGAVYVALYNKDIQSRIQTVTFEDFFVDDGPYVEAGISRPDTLFIPGGVIDGEIVPDQEFLVVEGDYTLATNNAEGGYIRGLELGFSATFNFLPGHWSGLGVKAGAAFVDSEITTVSTFTDEPGAVTQFPGLSEESGNLTVFYSYEAFETRLSGVYQGKRTDEVVGINVNPTIRGSSTVWDYQASYGFDNGMDLVFSISNLTDEPNTGYFGFEDATGTISYFGRQYYLGVNYSF